MKRRWKWTLTGFLTALALCLCPRFAGAAPHEDMPTVKTFAFSCSGMSVDQMRSYQTVSYTHLTLPTNSRV